MLAGLWALGGVFGCAELDFDEEEIGTESGALTGGNLGGANLGGANLAGTNLAGANLAGNNLAGLNLGGTNLAGANLAGNNLAGANLAGNNLAGANLAGANLGGLNLAGANLAGANLAGANLAGSDLGGSSIVGTYAGEPCPISNTVAGALGTDLTANSMARNIHGGVQTGMLRSGEDKYTRANACVVMGFGSTAFAKLVDRIRTDGGTTVHVALRDLEWGFAQTAGGPMALRAWEAVIWGGSKYAVFLLGAPPRAEWSAIAGFVKAVFRWAAPPTMTIHIGRIGGGAPVQSHTGMMDAARRYMGGEIDDRSYIAGLLTFTTATTNNIGVTVDFSAWARKGDGSGAILGNVTTPSGPTHAEAAYVAQEDPDGSVSIVIRPIDTWNRSTQAATGIASGLGDLENAYSYWRANPTTPKPIPLRCPGALLAKALNVDDTSWQHKCDSTVTFAGHGNVTPAVGSDDTTGAGAWSSSAGGSAFPYNSYMTIAPTGGAYKRCRSDAIDQASTDESCAPDEQMPVLAETLVHTWNPAFDTTSMPVQIEAGEHYTCVRRGDKTVWCWGRNNHGQLGRPIGNTREGNEADTPGPVVLANGSLLTGIEEISLTAEFTCGRKGDGTVWCWGNNRHRSMGTSSLLDIEATPVQTPITGAVKIAAGQRHGCAVISDGTVKCWGDNNAGQTGRGTFGVAQSTPAPVKVNSMTNLTGITQMDAGQAASCAVKSDGTVWCWGYNHLGQLGNGNQTNQAYAVKASITGVASVSVGWENSCALKTDSTVWCWGGGGLGQLGNGTTTHPSLTPVQVKIDAATPLTGVDKLSHMSSEICAHKPDGTAWCWGHNWAASLGRGHGATVQPWAAPVTVLDKPIQQIAVGTTHGCAILSNGAVKCWGDDHAGNLGIATVHSAIALKVDDLGQAVAQIGAGMYNTCARKSDGTVWCWGQHMGGTRPVQVRAAGGANLTNVAELKMSQPGGCARKTDGRLWCWGENGFWQHTTTSPTFNSVAVQIKASSTADLTGVQEVAVGNGHICARVLNGTSKEVRCWGRNAVGQLGNGNTTQQQYPIKVSTWTDVIGIAAAGNHSCALRSDGTVWCWGDNTNGRLGDGTTTARPLPGRVKVSSTTYLSNVTALYGAPVGDTTCAKKSDGTLWCWGWNHFGQVGDETTVHRLYATRATTFGTGIADAAIGRLATCVRKTDNAVFCVGNNSVGALGTGTTTQSLNAVHVADGVAQVTIGNNHVCMRKTMGAMFCSGLDGLGQLGQGRQEWTPLAVTTLPWN